MLKLGYKASAEQFAPVKLLEFSVLAEQVGFDSVFVSDHFQPWKHTDGHAPFALAWLGALGAATQRIVMGTSVLTPTFRYHPVDRGAGVRHAGRDVPGPRDPRRRHRRVAERGAVHRHGVARVQGALRPAARGGSADAQAVDRGARDASRASSTRPRRRRSTTSRTSRCRSMSRRPGRRSPNMPGGRRDGFICTSGKAWKLYTETLLPNVEEGLKLAAKPHADYDRMIEMKVSFDTDRERAMEDTRHWAALALTPEEKVSVEDPIEMETPRRRAAGGARGQPLDRLDRPGRARREDPAVYRAGLPPSGVPRAGPGSGAVPAAVRRAGAAEAARSGFELSMPLHRDAARCGSASVRRTDCA